MDLFGVADVELFGFCIVSLEEEPPKAFANFKRGRKEAAAGAPSTPPSSAIRPQAGKFRNQPPASSLCRVVAKFARSGSSATGRSDWCTSGIARTAQIISSERPHTPGIGSSAGSPTGAPTAPSFGSAHRWRDSAPSRCGLACSASGMPWMANSNNIGRTSAHAAPRPTPRTRNPPPDRAQRCVRPAHFHWPPGEPRPTARLQPPS